MQKKRPVCCQPLASCVLSASYCAPPCSTCLLICIQKLLAGGESGFRKAFQKPVSHCSNGLRVVEVDLVGLCFGFNWQVLDLQCSENVPQADDVLSLLCLSHLAMLKLVGELWGFLNDGV